MISPSIQIIPCCCNGAQDDIWFFWPPGSPDLTLCDYFLWSYVKDVLLVPLLPTDIPELQPRITEAVASCIRGYMKQIWEKCNRHICHISSGTPNECLLGSKKTFWDSLINQLILIFMNSWKNSLFLNCLVYLLDFSTVQRSIFLPHMLHTLVTKRYILLARHQMWPKAHASCYITTYRNETNYQDSTPTSLFSFTIILRSIYQFTPQYMLHIYLITHQHQERTFSAFLSPLSRAFTASLSAFTTSAGLFWDLPNKGMIEMQMVTINARTNHLSLHSGIRKSTACKTKTKTKTHKSDWDCTFN